MNRENLTEILTRWGEALQFHPERERIIRLAGDHNPWFTPPNVDAALEAISANMLDQDALREWLSGIPVEEPQRSIKTVGLVMAGNIPMVGFHDVLCALVSGHRLQIKLSSKDPVLLPWALELLVGLYPPFAGRWQFVERLRDFDAVIATGSGNSSRYFHYYFGKYPHLIRSNRTSVAVLQGDETPEEMEALGRDVFLYFGLGCRSISHLFLPAGFDPSGLPEKFSPFYPIIEHPRYRHNFDYQRTLLLLNRTPHVGNDFLSLVENDALFSPISVLHYRFYRDGEHLQAMLDHLSDQLQVVEGRGTGRVAFGMGQRPGPADYADHMNTLEFLSGI